MTDAQAALAQVREALAAGPTPGEWFAVNDGTRGEPFMNVKAERISGRGPTHEVAICATGDSPQSMETANARYIAACHPEAIRELLAAHDALKAENEKLLTLERDVLSTLPGVYYMDPPDGGDASLLKQLERMSNDAARYRLLRRKFAIISDGEGNAEFCPINLSRPTYIAPNAAIELDTALDRERLGLDGTRPPTPVGWSDTDWIKRLQEQAEQPHPLAGQHINQGSMDAAADAYEAEYYDALKRDARRYRDWLRGGANIPPESTRWPRWEVRQWDGRHWITLFAEQMDAAIDAAMGLTQPADE